MAIVILLMNWGSNSVLHSINKLFLGHTYMTSDSWVGKKNLASLSGNATYLNTIKIMWSFSVVRAEVIGKIGETTCS